MDKQTHYRHCVLQVLEQHRHLSLTPNGLEVQVITDTAHDHYLVLHLGWNDLKRVYYPILHLDIKEGKVWVQVNNTDSDIGEVLVEMGVERSDIIAGLHPPYKRPYTGYGVA
jgi:hypothetical protein